MTNIIDGKNIAEGIISDVRDEIQMLGLQLSLAVILIGNNPASAVYVKNKKKAAERAGIKSHVIYLPSETTEIELINTIRDLNADKNINGILVQLPLPDHISSQTIIEEIDPNKDVDGFHPYNIGRLACRLPSLVPCTPRGVIHLLNSTGETYKGRHAVIVGASNIVGRPMALELMLAGATVTVCHRFTQGLVNHTRHADILISATGRPASITWDYVKVGATVIDVGITRGKDGKVYGDVDFEHVKRKAAHITPVPGGVGPMTVAILMQNTLRAYNRGLLV